MQSTLLKFIHLITFKANLDLCKSSLVFVVIRALSGRSLYRVDGWYGIYIRELCKSSSDWFDFDDYSIFRNSRLSFPESKCSLGC